MKQFDLEKYYSNISFLANRNNTNFADISRRIGNSPNYLSLSKDRGQSPNIQTVVNIANLFDITVDDLLFTDFEQLELDIAETEKRLEDMKKKLGVDKA